MGFYNPFTYFIKSFIRLFTRKFFWVILFLLFIFLGFIVFCNDTVFGATVTSYESRFGYYSGYSSTVIENFNNFIEDNNSGYDSFFVRENLAGTYTFWFYNYDVVHDIYVSTYAQGLDLPIYISTNSGPNASYLMINTDSNLNITESNTYNSAIANVGIRSKSNDGVIWFYSNRNIYTNSTLDNIYFESSNTSIQDELVVRPYFITTDTELETFDFDYLQINGGTTLYSYYFEPLDVVYNADYLLQYRYKGVVTEIDVKPYLTVNDDQTWQINIPYNVLTNFVVVRNGVDFSYRFRYTLQYQTGYDMLKEGTYDLTSQQEQDINEDSDKYVQGEILDQQKETNQKLDDLNNNITNDDVDDVSSEFGDFSNDFGAEDNTGIEQIFQKLYDAFCEDSVQDVVITIPFVNKTFTISTDTISSNFPQAIKSIVGVFVWGVIGLWVLKDIRSSINKIAEGSPEDVGSDVKKEVL